MLFKCIRCLSQSFIIHVCKLPLTYIYLHIEFKIFIFPAVGRMSYTQKAKLDSNDMGLRISTPVVVDINYMSCCQYIFKFESRSFIFYKYKI